MLDVIGIGVGPFNLSLAALLKQKTDLTSRFFEQKKEFSWHKSMIFPHTTLQVPFMAVLVTLIDPTSPYTFLNYLHHQHRLLKFYFLEDFEVYRKEYNHYCQWVAGQLDNLVFDSSVVDVRFSEVDGFDVKVIEQGQQHIYHAKNIVIATGTAPSLPPFLQTIYEKMPQRCMHTANFSNNFNLEKIVREDRLTKVLVLGSGQSAAEVYRELFDQQVDVNNDVNFELDWITRSSGFFPMEYAPLGLEFFSTAYLSYFYNLDASTKANTLAKQDLLHKGIGFNTIRDIYYKLYERSIGQAQTYSKILSRCELLSVEPDDATGVLNVTFKQSEQDKVFTAEYDCIIAGTGYEDTLPSCLDNLKQSIVYDELGRPEIGRDYVLKCKPILNNPKPSTRNIYVQNKETHSHGVGAGDLGLGAYRAGCIVNQLADRQVYDTDALEVFQSFGV